jgi:hypothetical protein
VVAEPVSRQPGAAAVVAEPVAQQPEAAVAEPVSQQPGAVAAAVVAEPGAPQPEVAVVARPALVLLPARTSSQQAVVRLQRADCPPEAEVAVPWYPARVVPLAAH